MPEFRRNIRLLLAYDGTRYAGWQKQAKDPTVQGVLEDKLAIMTGRPVVAHGAGRTDAGVHALAMVANFGTDADIPCAGFAKGLNSLLPADIRVLEVEEAPAGFHARKSARGKTYLYHLADNVVQLPTERLYVCHVPGGLDSEAMRASLPPLLGEHDFSSFEAAGSRDPALQKGRGARRHIHAAAIERSEERPERLRFTISGDGFLRHMVRNIVGTLIEVGKGKRTPADFAAVLAARDRSLAGPTAPAHGLFLQKVHYEESGIFEV